MTLVKKKLNIRDEATFNKIYHKYSKLLCAFIDSFVHNEEDAKDLTQEVFIKLLDIIDQYDPSKSSFKTWLFTIGKNHAYNFIRKRNKMINVDINLMEDKAYSCSSSKRIDLISDLMQILDEDEYRIFILRFVKGFRISEVSSILEIPVSQVKRKSITIRSKVDEYLGGKEHEENKEKV